MKKLVLAFSLLLLISLIINNANSQKLEIIPKLGVNYSGLSYISKGDLDPDDFVKSHPELNDFIGFDIKYKANNFTHVLSLQRTTIGAAIGIKNKYKNVGIIPYFQEKGHSNGIDNIIIGYHIQKSTKDFERLIGKLTTKVFYSIGVGVGLHKSKEFYSQVMKPIFVGGIEGENFYNYNLEFNRIEMGGFIVGRAGYDFYTKSKNHFLSFEIFWNQGLVKMAEYKINYDYGYLNAPQYYQKVDNIKLKTRGTTFGFILGVPIRILK